MSNINSKLEYIPAEKSHYGVDYYKACILDTEDDEILCEIMDDSSILISNNSDYISLDHGTLELLKELIDEAQELFENKQKS